MPVENDFLPFAIGIGANVESQTVWATDPVVGTGFESGLAQSAQINKAFRQASVMAAMLADFIVQQTGQAVLDNGSVATILANFSAAIANGKMTTGYLKYQSAASIALMPDGGNSVVIDGEIYQIPAGGLATSQTGVYVGGVAAQNLVATDVYDVFLSATLVPGALTFDFWNAGALSQHTTDTTAGNVGVEVRNSTPSGAPTPDPTRTYLGKVGINVSGNFEIQGFGTISWNRRRLLNLYDTGGLFTGGSTSVYPTLTEINAGGRISFLTFGIEPVTFFGTSLGSNNTGGDTWAINLGLDGAFVYVGTPVVLPSALANAQLQGTSTFVLLLAEGAHSITLGGAVGTGGTTGTFDACAITGIITG